MRQLSQRIFAPALPVVAMGVFVAVALTALLGFELWREYGEIEAQAYRETSNLAAVLETHVATSMEGAAQELRAFRERGQIALVNNTVDTPSFATELALLPQGLPQVAGLILVDSNGRVVASSLATALVGESLADKSFYREALAAKRAADDSYIGTLLRDESFDRWFIPMSAVIHGPNGAPIGLAIVMIDPRAFVALFTVLDIGKYSAVTLLQDDGVIIARSPNEGRFVGRTVAGGELDRRIASQAPAGSLRIKGVLYGRDLFLSYRRVTGAPYVINVAFDADQILSPWNRLATLYAALGCALLLAVALLIWIVRQDQLRRAKMAAAQQVQDIIESMSTQVALLDSGGRVLEVNRAFLVAGGCTRADIIGRPLWDAFWYSHSPENQKHVRLAIERAAGGEIARGDFVLRTANDAFSTVDTTFQPIHESGGGATRIIVSGVDVTEQRRIEQQLAQSQKLEAIGLLAGGIAHDFNNLLSAIANFSGFLEEDLKAHPSEQSYATRISRACEYGKQVVRQLLAYARPATAARMVLDLRAVLAEMEMLVRPSLKPTTALRVAGAAEAVHVRADQAQLVQVLVNLCLNARDALPAQQGTVRVELTTVHSSDLNHPARQFAVSLRPDWAVRRAGRLDASRSYALVMVTDDGHGMDPQTLNCVFDPFFTTKPSGQGTGLGLPIVDSIVLSLDGAYKVETRRGEGTRFSLYLPLVEAGSRAPEPPELLRAPKPAHKIRVLFVDDDFVLADTMAQAMTRRQCECVAVDDPAEALAAIAEQPDAWDVIVTDEHMPEMNGTDLIAKVKARYPDIPVILCTGSDTVSEAAARRKGAVAFFRKPVEPARLAEAIRAAFDAARNTHAV